MSAVQAPSESALEMYKFARSALTEYKQSVRIQDLDRAILLFHEALLQRSVLHPMRTSALNDLAMALLTRFDYLGCTEFLDGAIALVCESGTESSNVMGEGGDNSQVNSVSFPLMRSDRGER